MSATQKTTYPAVLGQVLEEQRKKSGMDQGEIAVALNISQPSWSRIEKGQSVINAEQLNLAAKAFGTEVHLLMKTTDERLKLLETSGVDVVSTKEQKQSNSGPGLGTVLVGAALTGFILALLARK